jgi:hypothetical protein
MIGVNVMEDFEQELPSELDVLKDKADVMGVKYRKDITLANLQSKVDEAMTDVSKEPAKKPVTASRVELKRECSELVRVRIACMDPSKKEYTSEIFCTGNRVVGTFKECVPFDVEWHVPKIVLKMIKRKMTQVFVSKKDERGRQIRESKLIRAYSVEVLEPLTKQELADLAQRQAMAKGTATA